MTSTPLTEIVYNHLTINVKRDDLFPIVGGGSKGRKLYYILNKAVKEGYNAVVTTGSNQSNHMRSTAIMAAQIGWKSIMIVHDKQPVLYTGNLKITSMTASELRFVNKEEVKDAMDKAMQDLTLQGYKPLYIWGGGHSVEGAYAYYKAVEELSGQLDKAPDYIVVASGTGTTQAGIEIGVKKFMPSCKVLGVSISREKERGLLAVYNSMVELNAYLNLDLPLDSNEVCFDDSFVGKGYEDVYPNLVYTISNAAKKHGLILDPTYTGKAFHAMLNYIDNGIIEHNAKVVFWHTGGLLNLTSSNNI